jgi:hypothetical protein
MRHFADVRAIDNAFTPRIIIGRFWLCFSRNWLKDWKLWSHSPEFQELLRSMYSGDFKKFDTDAAWAAKLPKPETKLYQPDFDEGARVGHLNAQRFIDAGGRKMALQVFTGAPYDDFEKNVKTWADEALRKNYEPEDITSPGSFKAGYLTAVAQDVGLMTRE